MADPDSLSQTRRPCLHPPPLSTTTTTTTTTGTTTTESHFSSVRNLLRAALRVRVLRCRNLLGRRDPLSISTIDPYVVIRHGRNESRSAVRTRVSTAGWVGGGGRIGSGGECDFNWEATFPFDPALHSLAAVLLPVGGGGGGGDNGGDVVGGGLALESRPPPSLEIVVMAQNIVRGDDEIGRATLPHSRLVPLEGESNSLCASVALTRRGSMTGREKVAGEMDVEIWWERFPSPPLSPATTSSGRNTTTLPVPILHCVCNLNLGGGFIRMALDGGKYTPFKTWQMNLWLVRDVFGDAACGWNTSYPAARHIYGRSPASIALRSAIRNESLLLYSHDTRAAAPYVVRTVRGGRDFVSLLPPSHPDSGKSTRFTYVILSDPVPVLRFSVTGPGFGQDKLSKHAVHAAASESVTYAGEFFVDRRTEHAQYGGGAALVFDNNSGTFAPPKEKLPLLRSLLEINLGDEVPILALDRDDPALRECFEENNVE